MRIRLKKSGKKTYNDTPDERVIRAASILMQMANGKNCFAKYESPSLHIKDGVVKLSDRRLTQNTEEGCYQLKKDKLRKMEHSEKLELQSARATENTEEGRYRLKKDKLRKMENSEKLELQSARASENSKEGRYHLKKDKLTKMDNSEKIELQSAGATENTEEGCYQLTKMENSEKLELQSARATENTEEGCYRVKKDKLTKMENSEKIELQFARATVTESKSRKRTFQSLEISGTRNLQKELEKETRHIVPTDTGTFSFSIIHLLCAVRNAFITPPAENNSIIFDKYVEASKKEQRSDSRVVIQFNRDGEHFSGPKGFVQSHLPSLTTREIVKRVRLNPRDYRILEANEPLQELVSGVLKVFSSRTPSVGGKSRKALVEYERQCGRWSWIGPLPSLSLHIEETSSEYWGLPFSTLLEMVNSFAYWLKKGQEMLQEISTFPEPPPELMQYDSIERFKEFRPTKSLRTIRPSCEEIKAYFRREEILRYTVPDRAFSYTAVDGRRSAVAPLKRCSGKPIKKARDHPILKPERPPHFTVLCLVRDAAARLPEGVGTRADISVLVRDSQYMVEDISDLQVNQVVSGALDRLHYENDPCVKFDKDWGLWTYLHGDRKEADFVHDATCSTKHKKKAKKHELEL